MEDVLEVYQRPFDPLRPVVCIDEMNRQLVEEVRIPSKAGQPEKVDSEYVRKGVMDVTVKKQKCPDFSIGATQKDSHGEPKISIFPPNLRVRRTCTSTYKWVDALEVDAGMP